MVLRLQQSTDTILRPFEHYITLLTSCLHRLVLDWLVALSPLPYMARYGTPMYDMGSCVTAMPLLR